MRVGQNPVKVVRPQLSTPEDVTIVVVNFIPYLSGYFERALDVLQLCLGSIWDNTELPYDLMVFDNASCPEVRSYLLELASQNRIQYLILSDKNVGIPGAWNFAFQAAPGKYIAYADNDIYFHPGWLLEHLRVIETYPDVGMVTGIPLRSPLKYSTSTLEWAEKNPQVSITRGVLQEWEIYWTHARSTGWEEERAREAYPQGEDIRFEYKGVATYLGAGHFQFVSRKDVLMSVLPLPTEVAMGNERYLDIQINDKKLLRLSLTNMHVQHMGNYPLLRVIDDINHRAKVKKGSTLQKLVYRLLDVALIKKILLYVHGRIFHLYYHRVR
jgi:glycosyltransferase involved in cell wall biosynthesis